MTPLQRECHDFIAGHWAAKGTGPTLAEIAQALWGKPQSRSNVNRIIGDLVNKGVLTKVYGLARTVRPTGRCPCCGSLNGKEKGQPEGQPNSVDQPGS